MSSAKITNVFGWVKEITTTKRDFTSFSDDELKHWNSYMVHKILTMNPDNLIVVNEIQSIPPQNIQMIYEIYRDFIPKNSRYYKYIKSKTKTYNSELLTYLCAYYGLSKREIVDYMPLLDKSEIKDILISMGVEDKEIKKILK